MNAIQADLAAAMAYDGHGPSPWAPKNPPQPIESRPLPVVPAELCATPQWVGWKSVPAEPKSRKLPIDPKTGKAASSTDPATWADYNAATAGVERYGLVGVGFVFTERDPFAGVDLDNCRNPDTGEIEPCAQDIIAGLNSYSEVSPSGTGVKIFLKGKLPAKVKHNVRYHGGSVEFYDSGRYFTVTGQHVPGTPTTIEDRQAELTSVYTNVFGVQSVQHPPAAESTASRLTSRHNLLMTRAAQLRNENLSEEEIQACLRVANDQLKDPKPEKELREIAQWVSSKPKQSAKSKSGPPEPATQPLPALTMSGVEIAEGLFHAIKRFIVLSDAQVRIMTLWILHCHALDAADFTPYMNISSAEKQSGKTRLLEITQLLVPRPWLTGSVSAAVLFRNIEEETPTLLLDEFDAAFSGEKEYAEALRGVLNTGNDREGVASRCERQGNNFVARDFATFCPKAIAGIGDRLPDTVRDRSIPIRLRRKAPGEDVERFRKRKVEAELKSLADQAAAWALQNIESLKHSEPLVPDELTDRQQDGAEPLLVLAEAIGGDWPERARKALVELFASTAAKDQSIGVQLLAAVREIFREAGNPAQMASADLWEQLIAIDGSPWAEWKNGKPITKTGIARWLRPYDIHPGSKRDGAATFKGYYRESFEDAWNRYIRPEPPSPPSQTVTTSQPASILAETAFSNRHTEKAVTVEKSGSNQHEYCIVTDVTVGNQEDKERAIMESLPFGNPPENRKTGDGYEEVEI